MPSNNPNSVGYATIWQVLNAWPAWASAFRPGPGTQVNAQAAGFAPPTNPMPADHPSVQLGEGRILGLPYQKNSLVTSITVSYPIQILTGAFQIDKLGLLYTLTMQALKNAGTHLGLSGLIERWVLTPGDARQKDIPQGASPVPAGNRRPEWMIAYNVVVTFLILNDEFQSTVWT